MASTPRAIVRSYRDPVDLVWLRAAADLGWNISFSPEAYASWDGRGTLTVTTPDQYDADDSLAQLILHEICHALVQGPTKRRRPDWGLDNLTDEASALEEHACHRLQAALLDRYGLRGVLAVTTNWRPYWDALPTDPLAEADDPAVALARDAWPEAMRGPWSGPLHAALRATADIAAATAGAAPPDSVWAQTRPRTPAGLASRPDQTCGGCAWFAREEGVCRADTVAVTAAQVACFRWEPPLGLADCRACGACCRQGFDLVQVEDDDPALAVATAAGLAVADPWGGWSIPRPSGWCVALAEHGPPHTCQIYASRPRSCADFPINGDACFAARVRVGRSRA